MEIETFEVQLKLYKLVNRNQGKSFAFALKLIGVLCHHPSAVNGLQGLEFFERAQNLLLNCLVFFVVDPAEFVVRDELTYRPSNYAQLLCVECD